MMKADFLGILHESKRIFYLQTLTIFNLVPRARDLQGKNRELWDNP